MASDRIQELAALHALGLLEAGDLNELQRLLAAGEPGLPQELAACQDVAVALVQALPLRQPPPSVKVSLLQRLQAQSEAANLTQALARLTPPLKDGFSFLPEAQSGDWQKLPVPGAYFKLLSFDPRREIAVGLGKLDPGVHYPAHRHFGAEDIFMLSGDLHIGAQVLHAGDYHHAAAGSAHPENYSDQGCTLLIVLSTQDLLAQLHPAGGRVLDTPHPWSADGR